jgi:TolA-binding protein
MREFIRLYPSSTRLNSAYNYLASSAFRKKKYQETIDNFQKVDVYKLTKDELAELYFKRGYSYLQLGTDEKAKSDFFEIKDVENKYAFPANYYYSHLEYKEKHYESALIGFNRLVGNETFGKVVPFYITQIYFIQGKYSKVVEEAPKLLKDSTTILKEAEINRMIGESYFNLKNYAKALNYLQGSNLNPQGSYVIAYCYYKLADYTKAIPNFEKAITGNDSLSQNAAYHLADCYVRTGEKVKAKNAFYSAYSNAHDARITEDALFSFAKLSYELDFNPYNEAVKSFTKYLKEYPKSARKDECYQYLVTVYSTTKNYELAIKSIESLDRIDPILKSTYQKLIYFKGVEYFNNSDLDNAEKQFKKSMAQNADMHLNALNQYWLSEINYQRKDYSTAIEGWKKFQVTQGATALKEYDLSNYALGYAYFQRKDKDDYTNANLSFRKFLLTKNEYEQEKTIDATIRTADSYFMVKDFPQASDYYKKAVSYNRLDIDYSLFQKALCDGLVKNYNEKIVGLKTIETKYPNSIYLSSALNQIADTYFNNLHEDDNAITYYQKILKGFPNSSFVNNCYAQLGQIYFNRKDDDKAFQYFDKFVKNDRQSDAAKEILNSIKKIFETKGDIEGMKVYFESIDNPLTENELEKASYATAYDAFYTQKNYDDALPKWENYINKFPNGKYIAEAQFNMAECAYGRNEFVKAVSGYSFIIGRQRSTYTETSLTKTSYILYKDKKYQEALPLYQQLELLAEIPANKSLGRIGSMRCAFYSNNFEIALEQAIKVLSLEKLTPQQTSEAKYIKARSLFETNRLDDAMTEFKLMTKSAKNISGAEAYYYIGRIYFSKKDYKEVEKTVNKLVSYEYSNDDWNNKGMLLLADAYLGKGDRADAKVILETIIDSKPKAEFLEQAQAKLAAITAEEAAEKKAAEPPPTANPGTGDMQIQFQGTNSDQNLFKPEEPPVTPPATNTLQPR